MGKKQFDLSHLKVAEHLQGMELASFARRLVAYGIDWAIIGVIMVSFWLVLPLVLIYILIKRRGRALVQQTSLLIDGGLEHVDQQLSEMEVGRDLRGKFKRYMSVYIKILIYAPIAVSVLFVCVFILNLVLPEGYLETKRWTVLVAMGFGTVDSLFDGFGWFFSLIVGLLYFTLFTWKWQGQTPGKRLTGIQVVKLNGQPFTFINSFERFSGYTASAALLLYGFLQFFWERNHQTTHDKIVETVVVKVPAYRISSDLEVVQEKTPPVMT